MLLSVINASGGLGWYSGDPGIWNYARHFSVNLKKDSPFVSLLNPSLGFFKPKIAGL